MNKETHLEMIQTIISRMNNCSFVIKGWAIAVITVLLGLNIKNTNIQLYLITMVLIIILWFLDGFFISQERRYRSLYDEIRKSSNETDFSMDTKLFSKGKNSWIRGIFSKTLILYYIPLIFIMIILLIFKQ